MRTAGRLLAAGALVLALGSAGCFWLLAGAGAGAGTVAYVEGKLTKRYDQPLDAMCKLAAKALRDLRYQVTEERFDASVGVIKAKRADDTPVAVGLKPLTAGVTEVSVRVGFFGSKDEAMTVLTAIDDRVNGKKKG